MSGTVIFANGVLADPERVRAMIGPYDLILCADGGTSHALALGLEPDAIVGDLDSVAAQDRERLRAAGTTFMQYPQDKNETDFELTLGEARKQGNSSILVIGALGQRLDHTIGNISMLSDPALIGLDVRLDDGLEEVLLCRGEVRFAGNAGDIVSLLPWGGAVDGIRTEGLKWPLHGETLQPQKTRGVSNEMLGETAAVKIASGLLLVVHRRQTQAENRASQTERNP